ncbi:MAG: acyl-CoA dehydrogenase family protein [Microthrixaceae bacterium]
MDFSYNDSEQAIGDLAIQVLTDGSDPATLRELERSDEPRFDRGLWATLTETGILGATLPEDLPGGGGAGLGLVALGRICEAQGATAAAAPLWETLALGALPMANFAPAYLRNTWLDRVAAGDAVLTAAWHEDGGEPDSPACRAEGAGDDLAITGAKVAVPAGLIADAAVVPFTGADGEVGLALVVLGQDGVTRTGLHTTAASPDANLSFEGAAGSLIATGADALTWAWERAVATQCALMTGGAATATALTAAYAKERKQFDTPIATFQAVAHRAADAFVDTEGIRLTAAQALWRLEEGMDAAAEVAIAKYWAADAGQRVVHAAMHLHGGMGVDRDYPLHRYFLQMKEHELQLGGTSRSLVALGRLIAAGTA